MMKRLFKYFLPIALICFSAIGANAANNGVFSTVIEDFENGRVWMAYNNGYDENGASWNSSSSDAYSKDGKTSAKIEYTTNPQGQRVTYLNLLSPEIESGGTPIICEEGKTIESIGAFVYGDGNNADIELAVNDYDNGDYYAIFQMKETPNGKKERINWTGWKFVRFYPASGETGDIDVNLRLGKIVIEFEYAPGSVSGEIYIDRITANYKNSDSLPEFSAQAFGLTPSDDVYYNDTPAIPFDYAAGGVFGAADEIVINSAEYTPLGISMKIKGDESGNRLSFTFSDAEDNTFTTREEVLDFGGWEYTEFSFPKDTAFPVTLKSVEIAKNPFENETECVYIADPRVMYSVMQNVEAVFDDVGLAAVDGRISVRFASPVEQSTVSDDMFSIADGSENATACAFEQKSDTEFEVLYSGLAYGKEYLLVTDSNAQNISGESCGSKISFTTEKYSVVNPSFTKTDDGWTLGGTLDGADTRGVAVACAIYEETESGLMMTGFNLQSSVKRGGEISLNIAAESGTKAAVMIWKTKAKKLPMSAARFIDIE